MMTDFSSVLLRQVLKIFGANHPVRIGIAICFGLCVKAVLKITLFISPQLVFVVALYELPVVYYILAFAGVFMIPIAFGRRGAPESVTQQIAAIEALLDAGEFSNAQRRLVFNGIVQKYLAAIPVELNDAPKIDIVHEAQKIIDDQINV